MKHRFILATVALFLGLAVASSATPASAVSQSVKNTFQVASKGDALPALVKGGKGGIYPADVWCGNGSTYSDSPVFTHVEIWKNGLTVAQKQWDHGEYVNWVRLPAGTYQVRTWAQCGTVEKNFTKTLTIKTLPASQTVSKAEYKKVKNGMSVKKVKKIVGKKVGGWKAGKSYTIDADTTSWGNYAWFEFKNGKLKSKYWGPYGD
jgi:hypothetical protein